MSETPSEVKPLKRRTPASHLRYALLSCACASCSKLFFAGAELARSENAPYNASPAARFVLQFVECPYCSHTGAVPVTFDCTKSWDPLCQHPRADVLVEIHKGDFAQVCLKCGLRVFGSYGKFVDVIATGDDAYALLPMEPKSRGLFG